MYYQKKASLFKVHMLRISVDLKCVNVFLVSIIRYSLRIMKLLFLFLIAQTMFNDSYLDTYLFISFIPVMYSLLSNNLYLLLKVDFHSTNIYFL